MKTKSKPKPKPKHKRHDIREDGYRFMRYQTHKSGRIYEVWISLLAWQKQKQRLGDYTAKRKANRQR